MEYEKKYYEAQKWIESIYSELSYEQQMEAEAFFPELKESEDERIRKALIKLFQDCGDTDIEFCNTGFSYQEIFAWLEKQEGCEYIKKDWLEHIKQSWYKEGFIDGKYSGGTSKEWTINDAATLKELIDFLENGTAKLQHDLTKYANWLKIQFTPIEKQGEQKPADKVEPKFKAGDWVVTSYGKVNQVIAVDEDGDGFTLDDGTYFSGSWKDGYHLWTIQDAKDGDVLVASDESVFIYSGSTNTYAQFYIALSKYSDFNTKGGNWEDKNCVKPATKEQRDTLIKAMTDAGYTFDFEKKELKKISQRMVSAEANEAIYDNPVWSEEDEDMVRYIGNAITCKESTKYLEEKGIDMIKAHRWLESFKPQPKQEWSEEDEERLSSCIQLLKTSDGFDTINTKWLKSLKEKYTWKPSDEQMDALEYYATSLSTYSDRQDDLFSLLKSLKKLKGE